MAPKQQLDKVAWQWAETTDTCDITQDHIEAAYRVHLKACKASSCRRNCRGNPNCLNCLGEREWFQEIDDSTWHDIEDPETERRQEVPNFDFLRRYWRIFNAAKQATLRRSYNPKERAEAVIQMYPTSTGSFVGLKNLGATCYVNTFIQVWFHNPVFRDAVFAWKGDDGVVATQDVGGQISACQSDTKENINSDANTESNNELKPEPGSQSESAPEHSPSSGAECQLNQTQDPDLMPGTVCGHLQLIFGLLQFSNRRYIDPSSFIHCLGIDTAQQQDAQEFSKLFMSVLEDQLSPAKTVCLTSVSATTAPAANLIHDQFQGEYAYVTTCSACSGISQRTSDFYELDLNIKGHSNLSGCIQEFLQEEKLDKDNQYMCGACNKKQNASRRICLQRLPKVLNFQLLRFVFDRKTGHKKKLNTVIQFPELLDLSEHVGEPAQSMVYNLVAVLIHRGPSAYSGHYIAHIKDAASQSWHKFNDEEIEKMEGKNLQLGNEDELALGTEGKGQKKPKAVKGTHSSRNAYMLVYVRQDERTDAPKPVSVEMLPERLRRYIETDRQAFNNWVEEMKTMRDANVVNGHKRQEEIRHIISLMPSSPGKAYDWIDVAWLNKWLAENTSRTVPVIDNSHLRCPHGRINPDYISKLKVISAEAADVLYAKYSGGPRLSGPAMMCRCCIVERCKVIRTKAQVAEDQKVIAAALKANTEPCEDSYWVGKASLRSWKRLVLENMVDNENTNGEGTPEENIQTEMNGDGKPFVEEADAEMPEEVRFGFNDDIVCEEHNELVVKEGCRLLLHGDVWRRLRAYFPEALEFKFGTEPCLQCRREMEAAQAASELLKTRAQVQKAALSELYMDKNRPVWSGDTTALNLIPHEFTEAWRKFLKEPTRHPQVTTLSNTSFLCPHGRFMHDPETIGHTSSSNSLMYVWPREWIELQRLMETDVEVLIRRVVEETGHVTFITTPDICTDCQQSRREAEQLAQRSYRNAVIFVRKMTGDEKGVMAPSTQLTRDGHEPIDEKEFSTLMQNGKRKKMDTSSVASQEKQARLDIAASARRSSRHRRVRGEKELTVSATTKLWDLKIMLMKQYSAAPMDQHLYLDGIQLTGDDRVIGDLGVIPSSVLYLQIDEPCDDPTLLDDATKIAKPEEGFKGTGLLGGTLTT